MKSLLFAILFSIGGLNLCHAHVSWNPHTQTYTVDSHGAIDIKSKNDQKIEFSESAKSFK